MTRIQPRRKMIDRAVWDNTIKDPFLTTGAAI